MISNDKLRHQFGNLKMKEAFGRADNVLATAAKCITDVINSTGQINVDFADVCTVMKDGGVAILGSAAASGENRAQTAIENALTSPLLNDCEIKGAKWILININSAEGEHEFSMDEVEIIQNYLLSQAGEDTDVILGLGYDNTLGSDIGITLIATGFEQKDPFAKEVKQDSIEDIDKVVLHLDLPKATPVAIPVTKEIVIENIVEEKILTPLALENETNHPSVIQEMPVTETPSNLIAITIKEEVAVEEKIERIEAEKETEKIFFEISSAADQIPTTKLHMSSEVTPTVKASPVVKAVVEEKIQPAVKTEIEKISSLNSGGYLAKPSQIYADQKSAVQETQKTEEAIQVKRVVEEEPVIELQLIVKDLPKVEEEQPIAQQTQLVNNPVSEENEIPDETEALRRRANERLAKLRNLSFNVNTADPNNEFETVPAYLRRNMEMQVQLTDAESFYSNYTVKPTENNQAEIGTINTFLDGKKPD